jgi:hypothetical protein
VLVAGLECTFIGPGALERMPEKSDYLCINTSYKVSLKEIPLVYVKWFQLAQDKDK